MEETKREKFFRNIREIATRVDMDAEEADALAMEAVRAIRDEKRRNKSQDHPGDSKHPNGV